MSGPRALADRRLSVLQFQADLRELVKAWGTAGKLGAELGLSRASIDNQMKGYQPATAPMCEKLYGPGHGNRIIVRGPDGRPVERRWVGDPVAETGHAAPVHAIEPDDEAEEPDEIDAGVAKIAAILGRPKAEPTPQPPSNPDPMPDPEAPAAETAPLLPPSGAAGAGPVSEPGASPEEAAAGDGAAASADHEKTAGPGTGEARVDAAAFAESPAAEPDAARFGQGAGDGQDSPASDIFIMPNVLEAPWVKALLRQPETVLPSWSRIEDKDLLPILKGKAAGMAAEIAEIEAEYAAGVRALEALSRRCRAIERRRAALLVAIDHFEEEESVCGDEGETAAGAVGE